VNKKKKRKEKLVTYRLIVFTFRLSPSIHRHIKMSLANNTTLKKTSSSGTTDSPYLGSKISLVSKAKIRYEGILYTIDANESTVALSKVRSFGTEDRPTDRPVPARDEIFEYIIFRGADIEDLQVREPPQSSLTQDPAIVESSVYPDNARSNTIGTNTNLGGLSQSGQTRSLSNRGTMPSPPLRQGSGKGLKSVEPLRQFNLHQRSSRRYDQQSPLGHDYSYGNQRRSRQQDYYNDYVPSRRNNGYSDWTRQSQRFSRQSQNYNDNRFYSSRRQQPTGRFTYRQRCNSTGGIPNNHQQQTRNNNNNNNRQRDRSAGGNGTNNNSRSTLKFVGDFDFEKSNAEFDKNAIEDEIKKSLSIKTSKGETTSESPKTEQDKENQHTTSSSTQSEQQETNPDGYYDKQKSFFDRISCEATEKEKSNARRNRNEERRVNAETFGLKYRPLQQGGNQRSGFRRNYNTRYQRSGNGGGYGNRNANYYGNFNNRVRVY
jgi:protein LSM14